MRERLVQGKLKVRNEEDIYLLVKVLSSVGISTAFGKCFYRLAANRKDRLSKSPITQKMMFNIRQSLSMYLKGSYYVYRIISTGKKPPFHRYPSPSHSQLSIAIHRINFDNLLSRSKIILPEMWEHWSRFTNVKPLLAIHRVEKSDSEVGLDTRSSTEYALQ